MTKPRDSSGKFTKTKNPKEHLIRVTEKEKQLIEKWRKEKKDEINEKTFN